MIDWQVTGLGGTQTGFGTETSQTIYQKLRSAAANRKCDMVSSWDEGFHLSYLSRGMQAVLLYDSSLMAALILRLTK